MAESLPYVLGIATLTKVLDKIKAAATPDRFTTDYLSETLGMKGGSARPLIPFLKKVGFLRADGVPTDIYKRFRNPASSGHASAEALRKGYAPLFAMNEDAHKLADTDLRGLVIQATGLDHDSRAVSAIVGSFKILKSRASFDGKAPTVESTPEPTTPAVQDQKPPSPEREDQRRDMKELEFGMNLSYTINLNLPPSSDINVFNAIFRSLKENLLKR